MLRRPLLLLIALLAAAQLSAQTAGVSGIKFKGVIMQGDEIKVCLVNLATNNAKWIPVGGKTGGYIVKSCAAKVANPYIVLIPSNGRGAETILRLEEVAAPVSTLPVNAVSASTAAVKPTAPPPPSGNLGDPFAESPAPTPSTAPARATDLIIR